MILHERLEQFKAWLAAQGAEVVAPTNQYELLRFHARGTVHLIYQGRRGLTFGAFAERCWEEFRRGGHVDMGYRAVTRSGNAERKHALLQRDGRACFFCIEDVSDADMTVEHLVAIAKGGPNHLDNLALAHRICNERAANLPLAEKVKIRVAAAVARAAKERELALEDEARQRREFQESLARGAAANG